MEINKNELLEVLNVVQSGLSAKGMIEQSDYFCFSDGRVATYNDEISISCPFDIDFTGAIPAKEFQAFLAKTKSNEINLEINDNSLLLKSGRSRISLIYQSEINLPLDEVGNISRWKKLPSNFSDAVMFCAAACSKDMSMVKLTCININQNIVEASDGFRIANYQLESSISEKKNIMIPATSCGSINNFKPTHICLGSGWVHFKNNRKAVLSCRIIDDEYVNVSEHLDMQGEKIVFPDSILEILDRASIFSKRDHALKESVEISLSKNKIEVKSESEKGEFTEKAKTDYKGSSIVFSATPYLLIDILSQTKTAEIEGAKLMFSGTNWKYLSLLRQ